VVGQLISRTRHSVLVTGQKSQYGSRK